MSVMNVEQLRREQSPRRGLPRDASFVLVATVATAAAAVVAASAATQFGHVRWTEFAFVTVGAMLAQLFATRIGGNQSFHTGLAFTVAAALLLPPELVAFVCVIQHVPDWIRHRYRWYVATFNVANYVVAATAAWSVRHAFTSGGIDPLTSVRASTVAAAACAGATFVVVNHALLAWMLSIARGRDLRSTRLFSLDGLLTDLVLAAAGLVIALTLRHEPALVAVAVLPLLLIHRALLVPTLREQALRDHKTGLLNARGIEQAANVEISRATRFGRPLTVLMCDVDELREINKRHGHLVGDAALLEIADAFRAELREYDLCGRFGGDEFVVVLPETALEEAVAVSGRIERRIAVRPVLTPEGPTTISVSIGIAEHGAELVTLKTLVERADAAMRSAKRNGLSPVAKPLTVA